jgi:hypothetical protein
MPTATLDLSATHAELLRYRPTREQPDCGGGMLLIGLTWVGGTVTWAHNVEVCALVLVATAESGLQPLHDDDGNPVRLYSGLPGNGEVLDLLERDDVSRPDYMTLIRGYLRRLKPGCYYVRVQSRTPGAAWPAETVGDDAAEPFVVLPRMRHPLIYEMRSGWDGQSATGPCSSDEDLLVEIEVGG